MSKTLSTSFTQLLEKEVSSHLFPGAAMAWFTADGEECATAAGHFTYKNPSPRISPDSIYDVASITKSVPTSSLALHLAQEQRLDLEAKVITYLPEYRGAHRDALTVRHLLEFRAPFSLTLSEYKNLSAEDLLESILTAPMHHAPGGEPVYINATSILLTLVIESITNESIDTLANDIFFAPLGMSNTSFSPPLGRAVPTEIDPWRKGTVRGEVHDESAWKLQEIMLPGSAGLFSSALDLLRFARILIETTHIPENTFFSPATRNQMSAGLGWETDSQWMGNVPPGTFGKSGFTGCCMVIHPEKKTAGVFLSNATWPTRSEEKKQRIIAARQQFCEALFT